MMHWFKWGKTSADQAEHKFFCDECHKDITARAQFYLKMHSGKPGSYFKWKGILYQVARIVFPALPQNACYMTRQWNFRFFNRHIAITFFKEGHV